MGDVMPSDKFESLSEIWSARYDDRDDEALAHHMWNQRMAARDRAQAHPVKDFVMPDPTGPGATGTDPDKPGSGQS
jgi:hypothetical protein